MFPLLAFIFPIRETHQNFTLLQVGQISLLGPLPMSPAQNRHMKICLAKKELMTCLVIESSTLRKRTFCPKEPIEKMYIIVSLSRRRF